MTVESIDALARSGGSSFGLDAMGGVLAALRERRTTPGWAVIDEITRAGGTLRQEDLARHLGISQQAVSQRLRTALWAEEEAARPLAARLLAEAVALGQDRARSATTAPAPRTAGRAP